MDFKISGWLFYALTKPKMVDRGHDRWFEFNADGVRWYEDADGTRQHGPRAMQNAILCSEAGRLNFPAWASEVVHWYDFASSFIECELPDFLREAVLASDAPSTRKVLRLANEEATATLDAKVEAYMKAPDTQVVTKLMAKQARDEARRLEQAIEHCRDAFQKALEDQFRLDLLTELRLNDLSETVIDYRDFLELTTFDSNDEHPHTGESGLYAYRKNPQGEVVGISTGPAVQAFGAGQPRIIAAEHQRSAAFLLPSTPELLAVWVLSQGGDVQLALPGSDDLPESPSQWVEAVAAIAARQATPRHSRDTPPSTKKTNAKPTGRFREDAMARELRALLEEGPCEPKKMMEKLKKMAGQKGSCVVEVTPNGVKWRADDGTQKPLEMDALKPRLKRLNDAAQATR